MSGGLGIGVFSDNSPIEPVLRNSKRQDRSLIDLQLSLGAYKAHVD
jgi:hypothetical protein